MWLPESYGRIAPEPDALAQNVRPIFSGSVLDVNIVSGSAGGGSSSETRPTSASFLSVACVPTLTTLAASNANRRGISVYNTGSVPLFVHLGAGASSTMWTVKIPPDAFYEAPAPCYTGVVTGLWEVSGSGAAYITEILP